MSNPKKSKKEPPKKEEDEDMKKIDEVLDAEEEAREQELEEEDEREGIEEYDPNDVYDEEGPQKGDIIDVNSLTQKQRYRFERDNKRVFFLKALAIHPYFDIGRLAKKCKLQDKGEAETCIQVMIGMIMETSEDKDFPARVLNYFNTLVPDGYPNKATLDADDINELVNLTRVLEDKLINQAKIIDPDTVFGPEKEVNEQTINESKEKKKLVMMDEQQQQPAFNFNNQNQNRNSMEYYLQKHSIPDIGLMEFVLVTIPNPRPNSVQPFIINFTDLYTDWMQNPIKMLEQLKFSFGPTHGEHMFRVWRDYRDNYLKKQSYSQVPSMGMMGGEYSPYGFNQQGFQPMQASPEVEAERMMDKRMDKLMKMLQFKMMNQAMENQTPLPQSGQGYEEIYDQNGKVIKRIMLPNGHANGNGNPMESPVIQGVMSMMQEIIRGKNQEMLEVMKSQNQPNNLLTDFAKTMMGNYMNQSNPIGQIKEMLDITNLLKSQNPQTDGNKSIEQTRLEIDSKLAMHELDLKKMEIQHNWKMDENQLREQDSNVDKWLNTLQGMGESIIKPVAIKFLEGFGKGQMPGGPLGAMFQGQPPQQQQQQMSEQDYAIMQQQQYQQEQRMPPMQPIPPQRNFNQDMARGYQGPPPQPQQQQRTISAASERDIEQELQSLSPQQIQEIEDKMAIDDINREKVKNAIRAYKNGRRVSRPRPAEQVTEAQNVLFNPPQPEEELDEEDFDEEEEYEVPIARGDAKIAPEQKPTKKFSDYEVRSTTEIAKTKKLNDQQKAMLSSGQMTERELAQIEDIDGEEEIDDYSSEGVPMPAGLRNASEDVMVQENLKKTKQSPTKKKKKEPEPVIDKVDEQQEQKDIEEAEKLLADVEEIPEDQFE